MTALSTKLEDVGATLVEWTEIVSEMANRNQTMDENCLQLMSYIQKTMVVEEADPDKGKKIDMELLA